MRWLKGGKSCQAPDTTRTYSLPSSFPLSTLKFRDELTRHSIGRSARAGKQFFEVAQVPDATRVPGAAAAIHA